MEKPKLADLRIFWKIWFHPKAAISPAIENPKMGWPLLLSFINGLISSLFWYDSTQNIVAFEGLYLVLYYLLGGLFGLLQLYIMSALYTFLGKKLGGKGTFVQLIQAVGWSYYPFIVASLFGLLIPFFQSSLWISLFLSLANTLFFLWGLIILFATIARAHQFSGWLRPFSTVILTLAFILGLVLLLSFLQVYLSGSAPG
jgi:hypothetical protein